MSSTLEDRIRKFFSTIEKALGRHHNHRLDANAALSCESNVVLSRINTCSSWDTVPVELQVSIFARCRLQDIGNLRLVSRGFRDLIDLHETAIAREYLRIRRHGSLPPPVEIISPNPPTSQPVHQQQQQQHRHHHHHHHHHTREPQDDAILLSDLFPPRPPPSGRKRDTYTFGYLRALRRRQEDCSRLAYYLADRVLEKYMNSNEPSVKTSFASRRDRKICYDRGIAILQFKLTPLMYVKSGLICPIRRPRPFIVLAADHCLFYALFFFEMYSHARQGLQNTLYAAFEAGQLPVPVQPADRVEFYRQAQTRILQNPPFTDTKTLLSTHHCMNLLVCYMRLGLSPDPPFYTSSDSLISMLLSTSCGLGRVVEYFVAEKGGGNNQRAIRREFMHNMQADWDASRNDERALKVYGGGEDNARPRPLREFWFEAARNELRARGAIPHLTDDWVVVWEGARISIGCQHCEEENGWQA